MTLYTDLGRHFFCNRIILTIPPTKRNYAASIEPGLGWVEVLCGVQQPNTNDSKPLYKHNAIGLED